MTVFVFATEWIWMSYMPTALNFLAHHARIWSTEMLFHSFVKVIVVATGNDLFFFDPNVPQCITSSLSLPQ